MTTETRNSWSALLFLAVPVAVLWLFTLLPTIAGLVLGFFDWNGSGFPRFVGLDNFRGMLADPRFWPALRNSLVFVVLTVPVSTICAFALAAAISASWFRGKAIVRTILFLPTIVSIVAVGFAWRWLLDDKGGLIPELIRRAGFNPPQFLQGGDIVACCGVSLLAWPMLSIAVVQIWRTLGLGVLLYLASMRNLSPSVFDAARVDGASPFNVLRHVTWPGVRPMTGFLMITGILGGLQAFDVIWAMSASADSAATDVLNWYIFRQFQQNRLGFAAAVGSIIFLLSALATAPQFLSAWRARA